MLKGPSAFRGNGNMVYWIFDAYVMAACSSSEKENGIFPLTNRPPYQCPRAQALSVPLPSCLGWALSWALASISLACLDHRAIDNVPNLTWHQDSSRHHKKGHTQTRIGWVHTHTHTLACTVHTVHEHAQSDTRIQNGKKHGNLLTPTTAPYQRKTTKTQTNRIL